MTVEFKRYFRKMHIFIKSHSYVSKIWLGCSDDLEIGPQSVKLYGHSPYLRNLVVCCRTCTPKIRFCIKMHVFYGGKGGFDKIVRCHITASDIQGAAVVVGSSSRKYKQ